MVTERKERRRPAAESAVSALTSVFEGVHGSAIKRRPGYVMLKSAACVAAADSGGRLPRRTDLRLRDRWAYPIVMITIRHHRM